MYNGSSSGSWWSAIPPVTKNLILINLSAAGQWDGSGRENP